MRVARVVIAIVALVAIARPAMAQMRPADEQASALTHRLMSPYCPGLLLADCGSQGARELRVEILQRLQKGETPAAIEDDLAARFGPAIRTVPAFEGAGLIVWLGPLSLGLAGLGLAVLVVRKAASATSPSGVTHVEDVSNDSRFNERLQDELDALD